MGNPAIRPESSLQGDLNLEWQGGKFRFGAGGYVRRLADDIMVNPVQGLNRRLPLSPPVVFGDVHGESAFFRGWNLGVHRTSNRFELRMQAFTTIADDREVMEPVLGIAPLEIDSAVRLVAPRAAPVGGVRHPERLGPEQGRHWPPGVALPRLHPARIAVRGRFVGRIDASARNRECRGQIPLRAPQLPESVQRPADFPDRPGGDSRFRRALVGRAGALRRGRLARADVLQ